MATIRITKEYKIKYLVCYHEQTEGGMDYDTFGDCVNTLEEAIGNLESAQREHKQYNWEIILDVELTSTSETK